MLTVTVHWLAPIYEAALDSTPEWPPHPARLFCALVAAATERSPDDDALRWLEAQDPPVVLAPEATASTLTAFVPTNAMLKETRSNRVGRTADQRVWQRNHLAGDHVQMVWEKARPADATLARLQGLARRIPFLGRSTSQVVVTVTDQRPPADTGLTRTEPLPTGTQRLRVPYRGYLDALRGAFDDGDPARTVSHWAFYGRPSARATGELTARPGPYSTLLSMSFSGGRALDGRLVMRVTTAFKKAVLQWLGRRFDEAALELIHGHHDGTRRQCAFLGLPFVGHPHATGQLLGVGIALSADLNVDLRNALLEACGLHLDRSGLARFEVPGLATIELEPVEPGVSFHSGHATGRWTNQPDRWMEPRQTWLSAFPIVLDRYPHRISQAPAFIAQGCEMAGYTRVEHVEHLPVPGLRGAPRLRGNDLRRRHRDPSRPAVHARIRFPVPVTGPIVLGHLRYLGLGLCAPAREDTQ